MGAVPPPKGPSDNDTLSAGRDYMARRKPATTFLENYRLTATGLAAREDAP